MVYVVFDLEATCWDGETSRYVPIREELDSLNAMEVIEIGAVAVSSAAIEARLSKKFDYLGEFDAFVKPTIHPTLSKFCTDLTSITQEDVDRSATIEDVLPEFIEWARSFDGEAKFVSWGMFDKAIFERMKNKQRKDIDISYLVRNHFSAKHRARKMGCFAKGLGRTMDRLHIPFEGRQHRGIDDARMITKIFEVYFDQCVTDYVSS
jgi:inhibitor of KinA sporulation pathway (predicted exonuclease)